MLIKIKIFDSIFLKNSIPGSVIPAICIVAASYAGCNKAMVVIWFTLAMTFMGNYYPGLRVNILDLSSNYAGSIMALGNGIAAGAGVAAPTFVGIMTPDVCFRYIFNNISSLKITIKSLNEWK